jgi:hypothetical protein
MRPAALAYAALNGPMRALLRSPLHWIASRNLCLLRYRGRRSGRTYTTPLSFMRTGDRVLLLTSHRTRWSQNFLDGPTDVTVEIGRVPYRGKARTIREDGEELREGVRTFLTAVPRDAVIYGIGLDRDRRPRERDVETAAGRVVLVEVTLTGRAAAGA